MAMTPKRKDVNPKTTLQWVRDLRKASERRGGDPATKFSIRMMFNYIETLIQYQIIMPPIWDNEDGTNFTCPRCKKGMTAESGTVEDYNFCPLCGQRWKEVSEEDTEEEYHEEV